MLNLLQTNDFHGTLTPAMARFILARKERDDALYFDCGDVIRTGNLGIPIRPEPAWNLLAEAGCDASVLGNRESHPLQSAFLKKLEGAKQPLLVANIKEKSSTTNPPWQPSLLIEHQGIRVGVFGVMVAMVTAAMKTQAASAYLWDSPIEIARTMAETLRPQCNVLIALTHIGFRNDEILAAKVPEIDIILGSHSHTVLETPVKIGRTWIAQTGSHGRFLGAYAWDGATLAGRLEPFPLS
jgi:5'-nucleotidase